MGKLINRIPGSRLLISSLPGLALRTHVESLRKPRDVKSTSVLKALPGKLDIKRHSLYFRASCSRSCWTEDAKILSIWRHSHDSIWDGVKWRT